MSAVEFVEEKGEQTLLLCFCTDLSRHRGLNRKMKTNGLKVIEKTKKLRAKLFMVDL